VKPINDRRASELAHAPPGEAGDHVGPELSHRRQVERVDRPDPETDGIARGDHLVLEDRLKLAAQEKFGDLPHGVQARHFRTGFDQGEEVGLARSCPPARPGERDLRLLVLRVGHAEDELRPVGEELRFDVRPRAAQVGGGVLLAPVWAGAA
jgi:hypothetical protein